MCCAVYSGSLEQCVKLCVCTLLACLQALLVRTIAGLRRNTAQRTDERVRLTGEVIQVRLLFRGCVALRGGLTAWRIGGLVAWSGMVEGLCWLAGRLGSLAACSGMGVRDGDGVGMSGMQCRTHRLDSHLRSRTNQ
jgi:hypothetical protein